MKELMFIAACAVTSAIPIPAASAQSGYHHPSDYSYRDRNGGVHWDREAWQRAEERRKQIELREKRADQRRHAAEVRREREQRLRWEEDRKRRRW